MQEEPPINFSDNRLSQIVNECVKAQDRDLCKFLLQKGAIGIDKLVKLQNRPEIKKKFANYVNQKESEQGNILYQRVDDQGLDLDVSLLLQNEIKNLSQNLTLQKLIKIFRSNLLSQLQSKPQKDEQYFSLFQNIRDLSMYFELQSNEMICEDYEQLKPVRYSNYQRYGFQNEIVFKKFCKCVEALPLYKDYEKYNGKNILEIKQNLKDNLKKALLKSQCYFDLNLIDNLIKIIIQDPSVNFMKLQFLTNSQKQELFNLCWDDQDILGNYFQSYFIPKTIKSQRKVIIKQIIGFCIENDLIKVSDFQVIIEAIENYDGSKFYELQSIHNNRVKIHEFIYKNYPHLFYYKRLGFDKCLITMKNKFIIAIRKKLHQLKISHQLYLPIQNHLLEGKLAQIFDINITKQHRRQIIRFYQNYPECEDYRRVYKQVISQEIQAQEELQHILMMNHPSLLYKTIQDIIKLTLENGCIPTCMMNPAEQRQLKKKFNDTLKIKPFLDNLKVQQQDSKDQLRIRMIYIINEIINEPNCYTINCLINEIQENCNLNVIMDSNLLSSKQKYLIKQSLSESKQFKNYAEVYKKKMFLKAYKQFQHDLSIKFRNQDPTNDLIKYYQLFGFIRVTDDNQIRAQGKIGEKIAKKFSSDALAIKQMQAQAKYANFRKYFIEIFQSLKNQREKTLSNELRLQLDRCNIGNLDQLLRNLRNSDYDLTIINNPNTQDQIKVMSIYRQYQEILQAQQYNKKMFSQIAFETKLQELQHHQILIKYPIEDRRSLITQICSQGLSAINGSQFIRDKERLAIRNWIQDTLEWRTIFEVQQKEEETRSQKKHNIEQTVKTFKSLLIGSNQLECLSQISDQTIVELIRLNILEENGLVQFLKRLSIKKIKMPKIRKQIDNNKNQIEQITNQILNIYGPKEIQSPTKTEESSPQKPKFFPKKKQQQKEQEFIPQNKVPKTPKNTQNKEKALEELKNYFVKNYSQITQQELVLIAKMDLSVSDEALFEIIKVNKLKKNKIKKQVAQNIEIIKKLQQQINA